MTLYATAAAGLAANTYSLSDDASNEGVSYRIGDLAKHFGVSLRTLRFYEDKGLIAPRREGMTRFYDDADKARLELILLGRRVGFTLRDVKQMLDLYDPVGQNARQFRLALEKSEKQMTRLHKQRESINSAIDELSGLIANLRQRLDVSAPAKKTG